ncbi:TetR family transcriptional regulator [Marinomonas agarivorans]|nr:TetR family transcriptional regulator [Marinomonas agarivorans]
MAVSSTTDSKITQKNRQVILKAAVQAFAQNGFKGTSLKQIADDAQLPKTNVLYYFPSKQELYLSVLENILHIWNFRFDQATVDDDPATVLADYIAEKMEFSRTQPFASKVFAMEVLNGAENFNSAFLTEHRRWMEERVSVMQQWIEEKKVAPLEPEYLLYHIWACTQHYADFSAQIRGLKGRNMSKKDFKIATNNLVSLILTGCGLTVPDAYRSL